MGDDRELTDRDPEIERLMAGARPDVDQLDRAVWRSRVVSALFGDAEAVPVGRYRLERRLGGGGGGSVFVAADPELHRDVAVKLIRCTSDRHRERALAEARALAKLSHPNVVPVHDVGETGEYVYLVMELLRGASLRELAVAERGTRAVVAAYRQAASGLAAAHAVGLVHRDFKPDNALLGDDGRLRVVDFGLATEAGDTAAVGTPRYMAPEQRAGTRIDAAVDQYALGVALREAITAHHRREPAWLGRVIARATAPLPGDRFPSMEALARALGDDPRSRWRRRAWIGAPIALAIAGFSIGRGATPGSNETCSGGPEILAPAWTRPRLDDVVRHIEQLATPFATTAPLVHDKLGELGEVWLGAYHRSCTAHVRGELSDELYDRATVCLARARIGLGEVVELLAGSTAARLDNAVGALAVVDRAERCADPAALASEANPQPTPAMRVIDQQIETAAVHARASSGSAELLALQAVVAARAGGDVGLIARALLVEGHAYMAGPLDRAVAPLHEAMLLALATGLDDVATEAYARHAYALARKRDPDLAHALDGFELAQAIGRRAGDRGAFARALLFNNAGSIAATAGDFALARERFERSRELAKRVTGPGMVELTTTLANLATLAPDRAERRRLFDEVLARLRASVGPDHPRTLDQQVNAILDGEDARTVVTELGALCPRFEQLHPTLHAAHQRCAFELVWQAFAIGELEIARAAAPAGLHDSLGTRPKQQLLTAYTSIIDHQDATGVIARLTPLARSETDKIAREAWYQHVYAADVELALASAARAAGDVPTQTAAAARAVDHLVRALAATQVPQGAVQRRLGWARQLGLRLGGRVGGQ